MKCRLEEIHMRRTGEPYPCDECLIEGTEE